MTTAGNFRPTLLVGIGGTGSRIAEDILEQAIENDSSVQSRIGIIALDTDDNDLKALRHVPNRSRIRFSEPETVYRLLERNSNVEDEWCYHRTDPEMSEDILGMTLIEGAGQIRMLTRLALHDSFVNKALLDKFESVIAGLSVHSGEQAYDGAIHILIVGSLAGATGSGSFAQVALAMKQAARVRGTLATVRGVFLLPDVYARSGALKSSQVPNVLANGYASLKELNAITARAKVPTRKGDFDFEYVPGAKLMDGASPFEAVTFVDFENSNGGAMGRDIDSYVRMAARAGYLMIFSPLGARYGSVTVNDVRQKLAAVANGSTNLYSGIGVSAVKYPVASMRNFLSRKLVVENLKGDWMRLDEAYRDQVRRFKEEQQAGKSSGEEPVLAESFVRDLTQLAKQEPRIPFFRQANEYLNPEIEDEKTYEKIVRPRHITFLNAMKDYVSNVFWSEGDTADVKSRAMLDTSSLLESDSIVDTVRRTELDLDRDMRVLEAALQSRPDDIYHNDLVSSDKLGGDEWAQHHIQAHIIKDSPHPITVRAMLYLVRTELEDRLDSLDPRDLRLKLFRQANEFRDDEEIGMTNNRPVTRSTPKVVEAAAKAEESRLPGFFGGKRKAFAAQYVDYYNQSLTKMRVYTNAAIEAKVYEQAISEINGLITAYEGLFREIEIIEGELDKEIEAERNGFSGDESFDGNAHVYANAACKDDAWERVSASAQGLRLDDKVNQKLVRSVFDKHRDDKRLGKLSSNKQINQLFRTQVVDGFGRKSIEDDFSSQFDFSVIEAMRRQFEVEDKLAAAEAAEKGVASPSRIEDPDERIKRIVDRTSRQSLPYISLARPDSDGSQIKFWTLHPKSQENIGSRSLFTQLFQSEDGNEPITTEDFSIYELTCVNLRVNVQLEHLKKLAMGTENATSVHEQIQGRYALAYSEMIERMNDTARSSGPGAEFTPHIDKVWHKPSVLPEIFAELDEKISDNNARSYVVARTHGLLRLETDAGPEARFSSVGYGLRAPYDDIIVESHDPWDVFKAFTSNIPAIQSSMDVWEKQKAKKSAGLEAHRCYAALTDPEALISIVQTASVRNKNTESRDDSVVDMIEAWIGLLEELIAEQESELTPKRASLVLEQHVDSARDKLFDALRDKGYTAGMITVFDRLFGKGYDRALAS